MEESNVEWQRLAGTSAGALIAALLASGYKSGEIRKELQNMDYAKFRGKTIINRIPLIGNLIELMVHLGFIKMIIWKNGCTVCCVKKESKRLQICLQIS